MYVIKKSCVGTKEKKESQKAQKAKQTGETHWG